MLPTEKTISIARFPILETNRQMLAARLLADLNACRKTTLLFANTNFIVKNRGLLERLHDDAVTIVNDGVGMDIAARLLHGKAFKENLNGTDFTPYLLQQAERPLKIFMFGGKPAVVEKAAAHARQYLGQNVVGICDGYDGLKNHPQLVEAINQTDAELVLVALGNPLQEAWILDHRQALQAGIVIGVGALFDFWAGDKPRAPKLIRTLRLEWLYRLSLEPRRLLRRYTLDILVFLQHCFKYR